MGLLCVTGVVGHFLLIKVYAIAEAGTVQPFAYFQLVFVGILGITLFDERPDAWTIAGAGLILVAGLYTVLREAKLQRAGAG
jgi:drug/metabolite transporter (DMT)-like permease